MALSKLTSLFILTSTLLGATAAAPSEGCKAKNPLPPGQAPGGKTVEVPFKTSDNTNRTYLIHIPSTYKSTTPADLYFSFHGHNGTPEKQENISQFSNPKYNPNGIAVYPAGLVVSLSLRPWFTEF